MSTMKLAVISLLAAGFTTTPIIAEETSEKPNLISLLSGELELAEGTEFVVSRVQIPPNMSLPKHWHPGEEFVYVISGQVTLWQEGKRELVFVAGDAARVPLKQIHTAMTGDEGVDLVVFRVHEKGKPERVLIENPEKN